MKIDPRGSRNGEQAMTDYVYSHCEDEGFDEEIEVAIDRVRDSAKRDNNGVGTVYRGTSVKPPSTSFVPDFVDDIANMAYDFAGEHSEEWIADLEGKRDSLTSAMEEAFKKWVEANLHEPTFYSVVNVQPIKFHLLDGGEYEILGDTQ